MTRPAERYGVGRLVCAALGKRDQVMRLYAVPTAASGATAAGLSERRAAERGGFPA